MRRERGILFVLSAPSGTGKSTLARRLVAADPELAFSVSYTTRARRDGEEDGREYHFIAEERFDTMLRSGEFLEWAHVFGCRYGTGRAQCASVLATGSDLLLDIDVQGARSIRDSGVPATFVFVLPPDFATLERRLRERRTESEHAVSERLARARREAEEYARYDYLTVNDDLERAFEEVRSIVRAERCRVEHRDAAARAIVNTFPRP